MDRRGSDLQTSQGFSRPGGDITTLLDLTPRDFQDQEMFPLSAEKTWWLPDQTRRIHPFSLSVQEFPFRGPAAFGQLFTFDLRSVGCGDLLLNTTLQIELGHWLDDTTLLRLESGKYEITSDYWAYANSLGSVIIEKAELKAVIAVPSGAFKPYAGVSTAILIFTKGGETNHVWFYDMQADGYTLDDKRNKIAESDLPDIVQRYKSRDAKKDSDRKLKYFMVPKKEIVENNYDLNLSTYKEEVYEEVVYEKPNVILKKLSEMEATIVAGIEELNQVID